ncbi:hypothetical protein A8H37_06130 [Burkholderia thailandensis]|nr:hypothetical protein A8H37_06130 [Burkholderia thailandensis]
MNILDTAHAVAHNYPGGCESLAPRLGVSPAVLRSKVNPNTGTVLGDLDSTVSANLSAPRIES